MQLLRLRLTNFRQHAATDIEFGLGLTGVIGPNGAGKTTLLEAIAYALYGVAGTRGTRETLRRRGAPPRAKFEVLLEFTLGAHRYELTRSMTTATLAQDGRIIANSTGTATERVTSLLGMSREEFFSTYFTGQKELAVMAAMPRPERAQFLSRVLGYDRLREAQEGLREARSARRAELAGIEQVLGEPGALEAELDDARATVAARRSERDTAASGEQEVLQRSAALMPGWEVARDRRAAWQALDGERRVAEGTVAGARARFDAIDRELANAVRARDRLAQLTAAAAEWETLTAERDVLDRAALAHHARGQQAARRDQARVRLQELEAQLAAGPDAAALQVLAGARDAARTEREQAEETLAQQRTRWTEDVQEARTRLEGFRDRYRELGAQRALIEQQGPEGICPTCGRPLGADFRSLLELLGRQIEEVETDGQYYRQRVDQLQTAPGDVRDTETRVETATRTLQQRTEALAEGQARQRQHTLLAAERDRLTGELRQLDQALHEAAADYDAGRHEQVRARLAALEPLRREHDQLAGAAHRAEALLADAAEAERLASAAEATLAAIDQRMAVLGWDPVAFEALERAVQAAQDELQAARLRVVSAAAALEAAERLLQSAAARQADRAAKAEYARVVAAAIGVLDELDRAFSDLRTELNVRLRPDLAERASQLLSDLTAARYTDLELDESYIPTIVEDGEAQPVISGGEEDVVNLALRLAISQMIAERAGQPLSVLVLDEIFGALDEDRRRAVVELLRALSGRFPQVILITHVDGLRDAFDRVLRATYDIESGVTTVTDETPEPVDVAA